MKTSEITVEYLDHLGTDLTVVNAARTSFGKESDWVYAYPPEDAEGNQLDHEPPKVLSQADASLIRFLARGFRTKDWDALLDEVLSAAFQSPDYATQKSELTEILLHYKKSAQHWAPFGHPHLQIRMKLPIFLARQFVKHQIGGTWSEESRRYMSSEPEFWFPKEYHVRPEDVNQGSGIVHEHSDMWGQAAREHTKNALGFYMQGIQCGVAPEEARIHLPLNTMTTVTWTGSLLFWSRVCNLRLDDHAQKAANELAGQIAAIARPLFPVSWAELVE